MEQSIRVLCLEDDAADVELVQEVLKSAGMACQITRVQTRDEFRQALADGRHDVILADYSLPAYDGLSALQLTRELCPEVPFIFVSGTMGEDAAIEGLTEGATDYVLKHKLSRLTPAVKRALREAENRKDRKRAEEALRRSRAELRAIYDSAPVMMCVLDNERCLLYMNRAMAAFVGKTEDELRQQRACGIIGCVNTSDDPRGCGYGPNCESCALRLALLDTLQTGRSHQDIERRMTLTRGDERPEAVLLASTALIRVGDHMNLLLCLEDITQRKSAEQAIEAARQVAEASTAQYEEVVSMISEVVWRYEVDDQTRLVKSYISPVADRLLGLPAGAIGDSFDRFFSYVHPEDSPTVQEKLLKVIQTLVKEAAVEYRACRPDGTTLWVHSSGSAHAQPDGHIVVFGTTTDITARKLAEDALRTSEERYRRIVDTANEGIWCFDAECRTTFVNRQMVAMLGYSAEEMLGRWMTEFMFEEELPDHQAEMERRKRGMGGNYERRFRRKDGTECWAAVSATSLRDRNGQFAGSFGMFADITARKTDENKLTALQAQLTHASRLATLGELAAGVAHEINQPLCTIVNFAKACKNVASDETPRLSQIRLWSDAIALAAARSGDIVRRMLGFARRGAASRETIAVEQLLDDAMLFVRHDAQSRKVAMRQEMSDSGLAVCADRVQIQQVLVNLLRNSIEAFGDARPADRQVAIQARPAGGLVQVSVSDNGLGQPEAVLPKIFEPFFTTKPQGLGLGLPISKTIIEDHGGKIWAEARQGGGLTIHFTLPARKDKPQDVPEQNGVRDR